MEAYSYDLNEGVFWKNNYIWATKTLDWILTYGFKCIWTIIFMLGVTPVWNEFLFCSFQQVCFFIYDAWAYVISWFILPPLLALYTFWAFNGSGEFWFLKNVENALKFVGMHCSFILLCLHMIVALIFNSCWMELFWYYYI